MRPSAPVAEVGIRDESSPRDAQHLADDEIGPAHHLERLREHHEIEGIVTVGGQAFVQVAAVDRYASVDATDHPLEGQLDPAHERLLAIAEVLEQRAVTTAEVEHPRAVGHEVRYQPQVAAQHLGGGHLATAFGRARTWSRDSRRATRRNGVMSACCCSGSSRNASCPYGLSISAKVTSVSLACRAVTSSRD